MPSMSSLLYMIVKRLCLWVYNGVFWVNAKADDIHAKNMPTPIPVHVHGPRDEFEDDEDSPPVNNPDGPPNPNIVDVNLQPVYLGQVVVTCPQCNFDTEEVGMGIATIEHEYDDDDESEERKAGLPNMMQVGVILYPCGHSVRSPCMTNKVLQILNARDNGHLQPGMLVDLAACEHTE